MFTYRLLFLNLFIFLIYTDSSSFQMFAARRDEVYVYFFLTCNVDVLKVSIPGTAVTKIYYQLFPQMFNSNLGRGRSKFLNLCPTPVVILYNKNMFKFSQMLKKTVNLRSMIRLEENW